MNCYQAIEYIHSIPKFVRPLGNAQLGELLELFGNPQDKLKFIHIAGTNGKGSTASICASILKAAGYKTGLFTSPFIEVFNERIRINGENIPDSELAEYVYKVKTAMESNSISISEFAFITAVSLLYFYDKQCDIVVLETGMGGRLDATNIIPCPLVSVLTSISLDHMQYLGNTVEEITAEKCGIIKQNGIVVTYPNDGVMNIIEGFAKKNNARLIKTGKSVSSENGFIYKGIKYPLSLKGEYQPQNAAVALEAICALAGFDISDEAINEGLKAAQWMARFEFIKDNLLIDGGHNIDGIKALKKSLLKLEKPVILVMAMMEDKSCTECVNEIISVADYFIATELDMPRCLKAEKLFELSNSNGEVITNCTEAVQKALALAGDDKLVCICGSLYLAGEIRKNCFCALKDK